MGGAGGGARNLSGYMAREMIMGGTEDGPSKHGGDNLRRKKDLCLGDPEAIFVTNVVITTRFT